MKSSNALLMVLLLALLGGGIWFAVFADQGPPPGPAGSGPTAPQVVDQQTEGEQRAAQSSSPTPDPGRSRVVRTEVVQDDGAEFEQGITGQLVDANRRAVAGADVYLFESYGANPFLAMMEASSGVVKPPLAAAISADDGTFQLGLRSIPAGKTYELRVITDRHPDETRPNLTLFDGQWWDAGQIELKPGLELYGVVTDEATGAPVEGASVFMKSMTAQLTSAPTPGRDRGIEILTDAGGNYRFYNAANGMHSITAVRAGYAQVEKTNIRVQPEADNRLDFELPVGLSLGGMVVDADGRPIGGARVQAHAASSKTPMTIIERSGEDGVFELIGLVDSPFQLNVSAPGYVAARVDAVIPGTTDEVVVLEQQCSVKVKVITSRGRRLDGFSLVVKNWIPAQESIGNLPGISPHQVTGRDLDRAGYYEVAGLNPGSYKLEIFARGFAKNFSDPIELATGQEPPVIEVRLGEGGEVSGVVTGHDGTPLAGVQVQTRPNTFEDNAIVGMFGALIPYEITRQNAQTNAQGRFSLPRLYPGTYQLEFKHPEHYGMSVRDIEVLEGQTTDVGTVPLQRGTMIYGTARVDGVPMAQIKVMVSAKPNPENPSGAAFSATTITDAEGNFVIPKRLPPGEYSAQAGRQGGPQDIFNMVLDYQRTKQEFAVGAGTDTYELHFQIETNPAPLPRPNVPAGGGR